MEKKLVILALAFLLLLAFAACGNGADPEYEANGGENGGENGVTPPPEEKQTIRMVGFLISPDVMGGVHRFNYASETHQIEVEDFWSDDLAGNLAAVQDALTQMMAELAVGQGPDILYVGFDFDVFDPLLRRGMFLDLFPLIDADPDLSRGDFFPNILETGMGPDGRLATIGNSFVIASMVGLADKVPSPEAWTLQAMLDLLEESLAQGIEFPLGPMTNMAFWRIWGSMWYQEFVDSDRNESNFDNADFIRVLELSVKFPPEVPADGWEERFREHWFLQMLRGDQVLSQWGINGPHQFQDLMAMGEDIVLVGRPSREGGVHLAIPRASMGIHAGSPHAEAAWSFIRQFLLPETTVSEISIPLRIDIFEDRIAEAMTPDMLGGEELPRPFVLGEGLRFDIYAMTEEEAALFRAVVESAVPEGWWGDSVTSIIEEAALAFAAGDRSIEDTVRIIQNRAQTALHERR